MEKIVFGFHPVRALLSSSIRLEKILVLKTLSRQKFQEIESLCRQKKVVLETTENRKNLDILSQNEQHQGVIAFIKTDIQNYHLEDFRESRFLVILDHIQDPRNFGAILRSADLFGVEGIIYPEDRAALFSPTVIKASAGAAFFVKTARVVNISQTIDKLKEWGFWIYGSVKSGGESVFSLQYAEKSVLILGNEGEGIRQKTLEKCDFLVHIPTTGRGDSLNVSVAAGILFSSFYAKNHCSSG